MIAYKGKVLKKLDLGENDRVLEILRGGEEVIQLFFENVGEIETIESDPERAYSGAWTSAYYKAQKHFIFCGNPHIFLQKKIEEHAEIDAGILHADRLENPRKIWKLISRLKPLWIILSYRDAGCGEYNKGLMVTNGFQMIGQGGEVENGISERICVGRSNKCNSN